MARTKASARHYPVPAPEAEAEAESEPKTKTASDDEAAPPAAAAAAVSLPRGSRASQRARAEAARNRRNHHLPPQLHFPLVVVLNLAVTALGGALVDQWTGGEMGRAGAEGGWGRTGTGAGALGGWSATEIALLAAWRVCELALGWYANFDGYDLASLSLLSHGPGLYLLMSFYGIRPTTAAAYLAVDVLSNFLPFLLLRPLSAAHAPDSAADSLPNREIVVDRPIQVYTALLAGAVYSVTLAAAYRTFLPRVLVLYFEGIPTVEPAHVATSGAAATYLFVSGPAALLSLLSGLAACTFIFAPFATTGPAPEDAAIDAFDPVDATLAETVRWNLWGYKARAKVAIVRTAVVMLVTALQTYLYCVTTFSGVESFGAAAYASIWVAAALLTGVGLGVVGCD